MPWFTGGLGFKEVSRLNKNKKPTNKLERAEKRLRAAVAGAGLDQKQMVQSRMRSAKWELGQVREVSAGRLPRPVDALRPGGSRVLLGLAQKPEPSPSRKPTHPPDPQQPCGGVQALLQRQEREQPPGLSWDLTQH